MIKYRGHNPAGGYEEKKENNFPQSWQVEEIEFEDSETEQLNSEIEILRENTRKKISELIYEHTQRKVMRGIDIPEDIQEKYEEMRAEYRENKNQLLIKYSSK